MKSPLTLKMRAITLLSQREHSPAELRRKLLRIRADMARAASATLAARNRCEVDRTEESHEDQAAMAASEVDTLMAWLRAQGYLSEARFVESRINARASRYGSLRIKQELAQHGLTLCAESQADLRASEAERASVVWQRKFGGGSTQVDPAQRAKQIRFMTSRGFAPDVVRRVIRAAGEASD